MMVILDRVQPHLSQSIVNHKSALITREYKGTQFVFREDGYFNMTKAAQSFGKDLSHFMRSPDVLAYVAALAKSAKSAEFVQATRGRNGGSWGHPKLAIRFAQWLDPEFAVWCDALIEDILPMKADLVATQPEALETIATE